MPSSMLNPPWDLFYHTLLTLLDEFVLAVSRVGILLMVSVLATFAASPMRGRTIISASRTCTRTLGGSAAIVSTSFVWIRLATYVSSVCEFVKITVSSYAMFMHVS